MKPQLILLTTHNSFFGQLRKPWMSMNTKEITAKLGETFSIRELPFRQIPYEAINLKDALIFYTFSQKEHLREFIKDNVYNLSKSNTVIPSYDMLLCHENKGYQEILKNELGLSDMQTLYLSSRKDINEFEIEFPIVLKTVTGSNGKGVFLVRDKAELSAKIKNLTKSIGFLTHLDLMRRAFFRMKKKHIGYDKYDNFEDLRNYKDYLSHDLRFILQPFIQGLSFDYRVIIFGNHYYVSKRMIPTGDFKASGAKLFTFESNTSDELLSYTRNIYRKLDTPFLSLDIGESEGKFYLFEFQALHFGVNAVVRNKGYYLEEDKGWRFVSEKIPVEQEIADGLMFYLKNRGKI